MLDVMFTACPKKCHSLIKTVRLTIFWPDGGARLSSMSICTVDLMKIPGGHFLQPMMKTDAAYLVFSIASNFFYIKITII